MCVVHTPSIPKPSDQPDKPLPVLRNPFLDGLLGNIAAQRAGRDSLRIPLNPLGIPVGGGNGGFPGSGSGSSGSGSGGSGGSSSGSGGSSSGSSSTSGGGGFTSGGSGGSALGIGGHVSKA